MQKTAHPASSFTWKLVGGDGRFRLEDLSDSCRLYWDLPIEENNGLPDYESMGGEEYEFYVTVQENMAPFFIQQLKIVISVEEVPNKRPVLFLLIPGVIFLKISQKRKIQRLLLFKR